MRVPWYLRGGKLLAAGLLAGAGLTAHALLPRGPQPAVRLPLAEFGFPGVPTALEQAGASMLTVHFVDNAHLLLTYGSRGLLERIPDDPPDDEDRAVTALLVELPSGKVLARARWHLHDYRQYLWSLGDGRFLLRTRSTLDAIAPLANLASGDAFRKMPFVKVPEDLAAVGISPEHDMVTVKSVAPRDRARKGVQTVSGDVALEDIEPADTFYFLRAVGNGTAESPVQAVAAGGIKVRGELGLSMNGRGYLFSEAGKRDRWKMHYEGFDGKERTLSDVLSSCPPEMQFVSPSQFVVFSCRGSMDNLMLSAFDFAPHEMWEEPMTGAVRFDQFAYAQEAGRFALSRISSASGSVSAASVVPGMSTTQEIRIYQVESGDLLLKLPCSPSVHHGQNFDLSADGLNAVVIRDGALEVYKLPALSAQDKKDLAAVRQFEPPVSPGPVRLRRILKEAAGDVAETESKPAAAAEPVSAAVVDGPRANAPVDPGVVEAPRKAPSLLGPGEKKDSKE